MQIKHYTVNLSAPPETRWIDLFSDPWACRTAKQLSRKAYDLTGANPLHWLFGFSVKHAVGLIPDNIAGKLDHGKEIRAWSDNAIGDYHLAWTVNLAYELMQLKDKGLIKVGRSALGLCSSVAFYTPGLGMVHARNLDWDLPGMHEGTVLIDFIGAKAGNFIAVTVPGFVGVLSGVAKGRFSATINANLQNTGKPCLTGWPSAILLRHVFESCKTYDAAVYALMKCQPMVSTFIQVVGTLRGQACVIEVMPGKEPNRLHKYEGMPLGITNHRLDDWGEIVEGDSGDRLEGIINSAAKCKSKTLKGVAGILKKPPVMNEITQQSMAFQPKTGEMYLNKV